MLNLTSTLSPVGSLLPSAKVLGLCIKKVPGDENIYQGHVALKPFIPNICIIIIFQLIGLQLAFIYIGSDKTMRRK